MTRPTSPRLGLAAAALLICLVLAACSSSSAPRLSLTKAEPALAKTIATAEGWYQPLKVGKVKCPSSVRKQKGLEALCTVTVEGQPVEIRVVQVDDKGSVVPKRIAAVLSTAKAEELVRRKYSDIATVTCGPTPYITAKVGDEFSCEVTSSNDGRRAKVVYRMVTLVGDVKWVRTT